jgi:peptidoglycan/LPS O-acetylase OafA/YrhL
MRNFVWGTPFLLDTDPRRLPSLDGLRAISAATVLVSHLAITLQWPTILTQGFVGVRFFFVISGFLITRLLLQEYAANDSIALGRFYARRALRILPVYLTFVVFIATVSLAWGLPFAPCQLLTSLTFTKNFGCAEPWDAHLWSLAIEEQFYLLWPWLLALGRFRMQMFVVLGLIVISPIVRWYAFRNQWLPLYNGTMSNADVLMIGCLAAFLLQRQPAVLEKVLCWRPAMVRAFIFGMGIVLPALIVDAGNFRMSIVAGIAPSIEAFSFAYLLCSFALVGGGLLYRALNSRPFVLMGTLSYSIYIWQQPFFFPSSSALIPIPIPFNLVAILVVAALSYYGLERPILGLRKRLSGARPEIPPPPKSRQHPAVVPTHLMTTV